MVGMTGSSYDRLGILGNHEPAIGDTRWCPDCGRPQHYTGTEAGWCHDAGWAHDDLTDTWHCNDPRKAGA